MARRKSISHGKELYYIICIVVAVVVALFSLWGPRGYLAMKQAQVELETHRERVESLRKSNRERITTIRSLKSDRKALEDYARQKGYGKPGEVVQQLPQDSPSK